MGRIRSVHPGQWTDEDFVQCGPWARLLAIGLRNEADDNGIFEWKPLGLKMRLFPADTVDVEALLGDLISNRQIVRFEVDGRAYGAIRNFRAYQNPRSPKAEHPITPEIEAFVGCAAIEAEEKRGPGRPRKQRIAENKPAEPKPFPQNVENNSLMERERREEKNSPSDSSTEAADDRSAEAPSTGGRLALVPVHDPTGEAFAAYEHLRRTIDPTARTAALSPDRRKKLAARLAEIGGADGWAEVLRIIQASPFLRGETSRTGRLVANIDWLLKPENLRKVREGNYDERPPAAAVGAAVRHSPIDALGIAIAASGLGG